MKTIVLKDYYYEDRLILEEEWGEYYEGILTEKLKDFDEMLDIFNECLKHPLSRGGEIARNLTVTGDNLDEMARSETRFDTIKIAVMLKWFNEGFLPEYQRTGLFRGLENSYYNLKATFNTVCNNIHYGRIKEACIAKNYIYEDRKDAYNLYQVPQILIDEFKNHKRIK